MVTLITGAGGFIGQALAERLHDRGEGLILTDARPFSARGESVIADIRDPVVHDAAARADRIVHLATIPGGASEADYAASHRINLEATLALMEAAKRGARFVYASSIAVLGAPDPARAVTDETPVAPESTYGSHKLMCEIALVNFDRLGKLDAIALRLPGIVARPDSGAGFKSAFMSAMFTSALAKKPLALPVSANATIWAMSATVAAENLAHAAIMAALPARRVLTLPSVHISVGALAAAIGHFLQREPALSYAPDAAIEDQFGRFPPLDAAAARAAGFVDDGDVSKLVANVIARLVRQ